MTEEDIEKQIAQAEKEIGKAMRDGNYGACEVLNRKLESLHAARDLARKSNQIEKQVDASFEGIEQDIMMTRKRTAELNTSHGSIDNVPDRSRNVSSNALIDDNSMAGRLSPANLRAHNRQFSAQNNSLLRYSNIKSGNYNNDDAASSVSNFTSVSTYERTFVFKITDNEGNTHRFRSASNRFDALSRKCASRIGVEEGSFMLRYKDEEGDMVVLTNDDDVQEAVEAYRTRNLRFIRLSFTLNKVDNVVRQEESPDSQWGQGAVNYIQQTNAQRKLDLNATEDSGNDVVGETSFSYPDKIDADCIVERIPVVKRITSNKNKRDSIGEVSVDDEAGDVSSDEGDESSEESSSENDETSNSSMDDSDDEADDEQRFSRENTRAEERYEFIFNGKSNWIDESTRAFSKNISSMSPLGEPVTIAIASGVAVLSLLFLFSGSRK